MTAKSVSTSQAMMSPFRMCLFTASLTLPIPSSLPPSPTPGGKGTGSGHRIRQNGGRLWGRAAPSHVPQGGERGWLWIHFHTTRRCWTSSGILETSPVKNESRFGTQQSVAVSTVGSCSPVTDGAPGP